MTDPAATTPTGDAPAPEAPAAETQPAAAPAPADVESIVSERLAAAQKEWEAKVNERVTGFQRLISEKDEAIRTMRESGMSEDEREQARIEAEARERQDFETERWLFGKERENPDVAAQFKRLLQAEDPDEQWAIFKGIVAPEPATPAPATPEPSEQVPDIDRNNPRGGSVPPGTPVTADGTVLDKEFRTSFLKNLATWPGG